MAPDDEFRPRLGKPRSRGVGKARSYLGRVLRATNLAGATVGVRRGRVDGSRVGVGAGV
jgi:hypothetical protein